MNPLTQVRRTREITAKEVDLGISDEASWHATYKDSAYVFVGGLAYDLTEGDLLAVFSQYGEIVDVNLVRDKGTGKSKGFAFIAYEDQRSTILAVDNLNGAKVSARIVRVDHVSRYKKKEEEEKDEEEEEKKKARGICYAFQKGECNRGDSCKFSHSEPKGGDPRWGRKEGDSKWEEENEDKERKQNRGICYAFQKGDCKRGSSCKFSHQEQKGGDSKLGAKERDFSHRPPRKDRERETDVRRDERETERGDDRRKRRENESDTERNEERRRDSSSSSSRHYNRDDYKSSRR